MRRITGTHLDQKLGVQTISKCSEKEMKQRDNRTVCFVRFEQKGLKQVWVFLFTVLVIRKRHIVIITLLLLY